MRCVAQEEGMQVEELEACVRGGGARALDGGGNLAQDGLNRNDVLSEVLSRVGVDGPLCGAVCNFF